MTIERRRRARARRSEAKRLPGRLAVAAARGVLVWERAWPILLPASAPLFVVIVVGLLGVWEGTPAPLHWTALLAAFAATAFALLRFGPRFSLPTRREALARLEADGWLEHAPLQALEDRPFAAEDGGALWRAHLAEMRRRAAAARLRLPRANADAVDPWALRFAAPGLLAVALVAAGPDRDARFASAFTPGAAFASRSALADLWIEPPAYTGKAPLFLLHAGEGLAGARQQVDAPKGSEIVAQVTGARRIRLVLETAAGEVAAKPDDGGRASLSLERSGLVRLRVGAAEGRWPLGVIADDPPAAEFIEPLSTTDDARLALALHVSDDYGVAAARLILRLDPDQERPLDAPAFDEVSVREVRTIDIDGIAGKSGERRFDLDLQADPWAGLDVLARIVVTDGAGQTGETEEVKARLPARPFFNPLARAVIEQRQTLAVAAKNWPRVGRSFDALTLGPQNFYEKSADYLLIRTAFWRVMRQGGEDFKETVAEFWPLALQLEDEALELARRRLEAAQEALRQALERGASDSEIARLVEELRAAMQQYLQALAESGQALASGERQGETLSEGDLDEMLDAIRNLAQSGARGAARQALSDLENLLNNLRFSSQGGGNGEGAGGEGQPGEGQGGAAGAAGDLIGRQRDLANRSFERGQTQGSTGDDLAAEEGGLAGDLSALIDQLRSGGASPDPDGDGARMLGKALRSMKDAETALSGDDFGAALTAMEEAIAALRDGAEKLAEAQGAQQRQQMGEGSGETLDPLGRPIGDAYGRGVDVPEGSDAQRARDVLEQLRKRLSDGERSEDEVKYLERLLDWF
jgi:uncharacterized protein (TIGR02302 family)